MRMADKVEFLRKLQQLEFMTVELNLYLDTHPYDMRALKEYNAYTEQLTALKKQYEQVYGPLMGFGCSTSRDRWKWIYEPWPWENEEHGGIC